MVASMVTVKLLRNWIFDQIYGFLNVTLPGDPVMPGCLGLDAMWQLVGFYLGWAGGPGRGRALGAGEVKFTGQVLPTAKMGHLHH